MSFVSNIWGFSVIGSAHQKRDLPNQDYWLSERTDKRSILVVSDGLGSCSQSNIGSREFCHSTVEAFRLVDEYGLPVDAPSLLKLIHSIWIRRLTGLSVSIQEAKTTCLILSISKYGIDCYQLGDGVMVGMDFDKNELLTVDVPTMDFCNETNCVDEIFRFEEWTVQHFPPCQSFCFIACTDGVSSRLNSQNYESFLKKMMQISKVHDGEGCVNMLKRSFVPKISRANTDDKTLAFVGKWL